MGARTRVALLALAAAAALAGCGGGGAEGGDAYVAEVNRAQERFAGTVTRLSRRITQTSTLAEDRRTLAGYTDAVDTVVADLRAVDTPEPVRPLHRTLVRQLAGFGTAVRRARTGLASRDPGAVTQAQERLASATRRVGAQMQTTIAAINRRLRG